MKSPSYGDGGGSIRQIDSLVLTKRFETDWLKAIFLGKDESAIRLGSKSWLADVGFRVTDSTLDLWSLIAC